MNFATQAKTGLEWATPSRQDTKVTCQFLHVYTKLLPEQEMEEIIPVIIYTWRRFAVLLCLMITAAALAQQSPGKPKPPQEEQAKSCFDFPERTQATLKTRTELAHTMNNLLIIEDKYDFRIDTAGVSAEILRAYLPTEKFGMPRHRPTDKRLFIQWVNTEGVKWLPQACRQGFQKVMFVMDHEDDYGVTVVREIRTDPKDLPSNGGK